MTLQGERTLVAVTAGLGQPSSTRLLTDRLVAATQVRLRERGVEPRTRTIELREHAQDLASNLLAGFPSPSLREATDAVVAADGLIAVTPIFTASYSGLFKTFFDVLERDSLAGSPVLIAATGGTARHSLALEHALRPLFAYLGAATMPTAVYAAAEDWGEGDVAAEPGLAERIDRAAEELAAAVAGRERPARPDPYAEPTPFEELLASQQ
ncbi:MAG TPA: FMN reductase [Candidatus Limnocylindrales bacterium]|nr:FMN reductase [Candidatus Limnocylindrales bacterium]